MADLQWESLTPFSPIVSKDFHALFAFVLMAAALTLTGMFALNKSAATAPVLAIPASAAYGLGVTYLLCAAGVYV